MHVLNLGVDLWIVGNILKKLLSHLPALWGPGSDDCRLYIAWQEFKEWCRLNKYECPAASVLYMLNCSKKNCFSKTMSMWRFMIHLHHSMIKPRHSMPKFSSKRLKSFQHSYPELFLGLNGDVMLKKDWFMHDLMDQTNLPTQAIQSMECGWAKTISFVF